VLLLAELVTNLLILFLFLQTTDNIPVKVLLYQSILLLLCFFLLYLHVQTLLHLLVQLAAVFLLLEHQLLFELVPLLLMVTHLPLELMVIQVATLLLHGNRGDTVKESLYALLSRVPLFLPAVVIRVYSRFVVVECTEVVKLLFLLSLLFAHNVFLVLREHPLLLLPLLLKFDPLSLLLEFDLLM
jgi:hypothetical protein